MRLLSAVVAGIMLAPASAFAEATTTRIEPRPYYGATVTIEEGVRVFRPLPPHKSVIINPGSQTPVSLNYNESTERNYHYYPQPTGAPAGHGGYGGPVYGGGYVGAPLGYPYNGGHGRHGNYGKPVKPGGVRAAPAGH